MIRSKVRRMAPVAGLVLAALATGRPVQTTPGSGGATAQARSATAEVPDVTRLGPQVGEKIPDFTLRDQSNRPRSLASLMGPDGLVLVFFRSADW